MPRTGAGKGSQRCFRDPKELVLLGQLRERPLGQGLRVNLDAKETSWPNQVFKTIRHMVVGSLLKKNLKQPPPKKIEN